MSIDSTATSEPTAIAGDAAAVYCPGCGYDLRGATSDGCSECGLTVDLAAVTPTAVPWAHRRTIGRVRAFWRTVWRFTIDSRSLRQELIRPQRDADARGFRFWNGVCFALYFVVAVGSLVWLQGPGALAAVEVDEMSGFNATVREGWKQDAVVPWSAGVTFLPALPVYLLGFSFWLTGCGWRAYRLKGRSAEHRQRARALSAYASAPLVFFLPLLFLLVATIFFQPDLVWKKDDAPLSLPKQFELALPLANGILPWVVMLAALHRAAQWVTRAHHGGVGRYLLAVVELAGWSALGVVLFLGVLPWCVGLWVIVFGA